MIVAIISIVGVYRGIMAGYLVVTIDIGTKQSIVSLVIYFLKLILKIMSAKVGCSVDGIHWRMQMIIVLLAHL